MTKVNPTMEMKQNQTFSMGYIHILYQKVLKYFNDFQNRDFSVL